MGLLSGEACPSNPPRRAVIAMIGGWLLICCAVFYLLHPQLYTVIFSALFDALGRLRFQFPTGFFTDSAFTLISLALHTVIGICFLRLFIRLPRLLEYVAGVFTGIGLTNFVLEQFAVFFLLNRAAVLLTLAGFLLLLFLLKKRFGNEEEPFAVHNEPLSEPFSTFIYWSAFACIAVMTLFNLYHSLFFPVNYWDALIYYVHYGKMTYEQGGFPVLYCLQVGLGLGANYPHLYPLHQAVTATLFGHWSDLYGQWLCPLAGIATCIAIYNLSLHFFKSRLVAILSVLSFRMLPYVTSYLIWASDYALVTVYTMLLLLFLAWFLHRRTLRALQPLLCIAAVFPHINYLGWIVWSVVALALLYGWKQLLTKDRLIKTAVVILCWFLLAATWYARNYIVTGNPVYAFFPEILGGANINLEVLRSSENEWKTHGYGAAHIPGESLWQRVVNSPLFFLQDWRFAPLFMGIMMPGLLLCWRRKQPFFVISAILVLLYLFYEYVISGLYWYHIIAVFPILSLFVARFLNEVSSEKIVAVFGIPLVFAGIAPGISFSIMGSKVPLTYSLNGARNMVARLPAFPYPGLPEPDFYKIAFPGYAFVWQYINENAEPGAVILSHENRYHVFREDIKVIHLDDCNLSPQYDKPYEEIHKILWDMGIRYYLYISDEDSHPITRRLGHVENLDNPLYFTLLDQSDDAELYRLHSPVATP